MVPRSLLHLWPEVFSVNYALIVSMENCGWDQKTLSLCGSSINSLSSGGKESLMWVPALSLGTVVALSHVPPSCVKTSLFLCKAVNNKRICLKNDTYYYFRNSALYIFYIFKE